MKSITISIAILMFVGSAYAQPPYDFPVEITHTSPSQPMPNRPVSISGYITFPHAGYTYTGDTVVVVGGQINITVSFSLDDVYSYDDVPQLTYFSVQTNPSDTVTQGMLDSIDFQFALSDHYADVPSWESLGGTLPAYDVKPNTISPTDPFHITVSAQFPSAAYQLRHQSTTINGNVISLNSIIEPGDDGINSRTPLGIYYWLNPLEGGEYQIEWNVNGTTVLTRTLTAPNKPVPDNPLKARFTVPSIIRERTRFEIYLEGEFPSPGYELVSHVGIGANNINHTEYELIPPKTPQSGGPVPFRKGVVYAASTAGEQYYRASIDGVAVEPLKVVIERHIPYTNITKPELVVFQGEDEIEGRTKEMRIDLDGNYVIHNANLPRGEFETGRLPASTLNRLTASLHKTNFSSFPTYSPNEGGEFEYYFVAYRNQAIILNSLMNTPNDLQEVVEQLRSILANPQQTSSIPETLWELY